MRGGGKKKGEGTEGKRRRKPGARMLVDSRGKRQGREGIADPLHRGGGRGNKGVTIPLLPLFPTLN